MADDLLESIAKAKGPALRAAAKALGIKVAPKTSAAKLRLIVSHASATNPGKVSAALSAKATKARAAVVNQRAVDGYVKRFEGALGDKEKFNSVLNEFKADKSIKAADKKAIAKTFTNASTSSVAQAAKKISARNAVILTSRAKALATGGRIAGAIALGVIASGQLLRGMGEGGAASAGEVDAVARAQAQTQSKIQAAARAQEAANKAAEAARADAQAAQQRAAQADAQAQEARTRAAAAQAEMTHQAKTGKGKKYAAAQEANQLAQKQAAKADQRAAAARMQAQQANQRAEKASTRADAALKSLDKITNQGEKAVKEARQIEEKKRADAAKKASDEATRKLVAQGVGVGVGLGTAVGVEVADRKFGSKVDANNKKLKAIAAQIQKQLPVAVGQGKASPAAREVARSTIKGLVDSAKGLTGTGVVSRIRSQPKVVGGGAALLASSFYFDHLASQASERGDHDTAKLLSTFAQGERVAGASLVAKSLIVSAISQSGVDAEARGIVLGAKDAIASKATGTVDKAKDAARVRGTTVQANISADTRKTLDARKSTPKADTKALTPKQIAAKKAWETRRARGTTQTGTSGPKPKAPDAGTAKGPAGWSDEARQAAAKARGVAAPGTAKPRIKVPALARGNLAVGAVVGTTLAIMALSQGATKAEAAEIAGDVITAGGVSEFKRSQAQGQSTAFSGIRAAAFSIANTVTFGATGLVRDALTKLGENIRAGTATARQNRGRIKGAVDVRAESPLVAMAREQAEQRDNQAAQDAANVAEQLNGQHPDAQTFGARVGDAGGTSLMYTAPPTQEQVSRAPYMAMAEQAARDAAGRKPVAPASQPEPVAPPVQTVGGLRGFANPKVQQAAQRGRRRAG